MASVSTNGNRAFGALFEALRPDMRHSAQGLRRAFAWWRAFRRTRAELGVLSDRDLADIGVHRSAITALARVAGQEAAARV